METEVVNESTRGAILLTGASSGIGHALALRLAAEGYLVFAGVRKESDRERLADEHPNLRPISLDVTIAADRVRAAQSVAQSGLPLRAVVNNAGIAVGGPLEYLPVDRLVEQFEINTFAPIAVTQLVLPQLRASRGRAFFIGSIAGRMGVPLVGPYGASKAALAVLVDALRQELHPHGVAVSLFEFAAVKTPIWAKGRAGAEQAIEQLPAEALAQYGKEIQAMLAQTKSEERHALHPSVIADAVITALHAARPRERYVIGRQARIQSIVALLPMRLRDRLIAAALKH